MYTPSKHTSKNERNSLTLEKLLFLEFKGIISCHCLQECLSRAFVLILSGLKKSFSYCYSIREKRTFKKNLLTNPYPRDLPVCRSVITTASSMSPYTSKCSLSDLSVVW